LEFINQDVLKFIALRRCRIRSQILIDLWNDFPNQHRIVELEPLQKIGGKGRIFRRLSVPGLFMLQSRPGRFVSLFQLANRSLTAVRSFKVGN